MEYTGLGNKTGKFAVLNPPIGGFKTANSRWSGCNSRGDAARGYEQFQVPTWGMRALKRKPSWGRYFQNINFQTSIKQNGYSYAFHLWPINRLKNSCVDFFNVLKFSRFIAQPCTTRSLTRTQLSCYCRTNCTKTPTVLPYKLCG